MDTRRDTRHLESLRPAAELGTETGPVRLIELERARYLVTGRGPKGLLAFVSALLVLGMFTVIAVLAIATSNGWSILRAWG